MSVPDFLPNETMEEKVNMMAAILDAEMEPVRILSTTVEGVEKEILDHYKKTVSWAKGISNLVLKKGVKISSPNIENIGELFPTLVTLQSSWVFSCFEGHVEVRASPIHGEGVFAVRDMPPGLVFTNYPIHVLRFLNKEEKQYTFFPRTGMEKGCIERSCAYNVLTWRKDLVVSSDPTLYSPTQCGHKVNDSRGTGKDVNCAFYKMACHTVFISTTREVKRGEELLMDYGESYWGGVQTPPKKEERGLDAVSLPFEDEELALPREGGGDQESEGGDGPS